MPDLSNNSFIPKRGPAIAKHGKGSRQIYVFTVASYVTMFATLLAAGGVYLYGAYIDRQLTSEIAALNTEISSFSEADMQRVIDFNLRLQEARGRLDHSVSIASLFEALEAATIDTVQIETFNLHREGDEKLVLKSEIETDSFDSTMFQRGVYQRDQSIQSVEVTDVKKGGRDTGQEDQIDQSVISFTANLEVPLSSVPYVAIIPAVPQLNSGTAAPSTSTTFSAQAQNLDSGEVVSGNEENI